MEPYTSQSPVAVNRDVSRYSLSVEVVVLLLMKDELPLSDRSIQRACKRGHFDAILGDTEKGQRYFITPESVDRRIKELKQIERQQTNVAACRGGRRFQWRGRFARKRRGQKENQGTPKRSDASQD